MATDITPIAEKVAEAAVKRVEELERECERLARELSQKSVTERRLVDRVAVTEERHAQLGLLIGDIGVCMTAIRTARAHDEMRLTRIEEALNRIANEQQGFADLPNRVQLLEGGRAGRVSGGSAVVGDPTGTAVRGPAPATPREPTGKPAPDPTSALESNQETL